MIEAHLRKLRARDDISQAEESAIRDLIADIVTVRPQSTMLRSWCDLSHSTLLLDGWAARSKDMESGVRQFTELSLPGDFIDLHGFTLKQLDHEVVALTECTIAIVPHERLKALTERHPHLTRVYWFMTNLDAAIHREWMVSIARRSAPARMAHLFCETLVRLRLIGLAQQQGFEFPLVQSQLADCLGLTPVHVNRTLQGLRSQQLIELRDRWLAIHDLARLEQLAEFNPAYLYLVKRSR